MKSVLLSRLTTIMQPARNMVIGTTTTTSGLETNINSALGKVITLIQNIAPWAMGLCIVACGVLFITGRKGADHAKPWLLYIFGGGLLIFGGITFATWMKDTANF